MYDATISGKPLSDFNARLINSPDIQPATIVTLSDWPRQSINPLNYGTQKQYKIHKLSFLIKDGNRAACQADISTLCSELLSCTVKYADISYYYDCALQGTPTVTEKAYNRYQLDATLQSSYAYLPPITVPLTGQSQSITAQGNLPSPAVVTITPSQDIGNLTLTGLTKKPITISNLHANAPVTIDGESCIVTEPDLDTIMTASMGAGKWMLRKYMTPNMFSPDTIAADFVPTKDIISSDASYTQCLISDTTTLYQDYASNYLAYLKTGLYVSAAKTITLTFLHDDGVNVLLNGTSVYSCSHAEDNNGNPGYPSVSLPLSAGWNKLEFLVLNHYGVGGIWGIQTALSAQVDQLNAHYARDASPSGTVNKFGDCDLWSWPTISPGSQTAAINSSTAAVSVQYKPKFL